MVTFLEVLLTLIVGNIDLLSVFNLYTVRKR